MEKYFAKLKVKDVLSLVVIIIIGFGWLLIDQFFLSETYQKFIAFLILILGLFYFQYNINTPERLWQYINTLAAIVLSFIIIISVIIDVLIKSNFSYKSILIWIISATIPYVSGFIYARTKKKKDDY
jgi:hypothetical protein